MNKDKIDTRVEIGVILGYLIFYGYVIVHVLEILDTLLVAPISEDESLAYLNAIVVISLLTLVTVPEFLDHLDRLLVPPER